MDNVEIAAIFKTLGDGADKVRLWCDESLDYLTEIGTDSPDIERAFCLYVDLIRMAKRVRTEAWSRQKELS